MTLKERFLRRLAGKDVDMTPVGSTTTYGVVELMKKCGAERPLADTDPKAMAELALAGPKYLGWEWIKGWGWDITALSEAMGCQLNTATIDMPYAIQGHPYKESLDGLDYPSDFLQRGRFPVYREQLRILKEQVGDNMAICGQTEGPWTCASNLVGIEKFMKWTIKDRSMIPLVTEITKQAAIDVANSAFDCGADYFVFSEPIAGPALLSPKVFDSMVKPLITDLVKAVKGPIVLHICANTDAIISMMCETGVAGISIEEKADLKKAVEVARPMGVRVFGNVATATTLFMGTPEECYKESIQALENGTDFLCPGCGVAPPSPLENLLQLRIARDEYFGVGSAEA